VAVSHTSRSVAATDTGDEPDAAHDGSGAASTLSAAVFAPCRWFIARLYLDLLEPDDNFNVVLRKMAIAGVMFVAPMPFLFAAPAVLRVAENDPASTTLSVSIVASLVMAALWIASYVVVRVTREATDFVVDAVGIGTALCSILQMTTLPDFPWLVCFTIVAAAVLLVGTPRRNLVVSFWFVGYVIAAYTRVLRFEAGATRATLPGTLPQTTPVGHFVNHMAGLVCVIVVLTVVGRYITETHAKQVAADAAVALASEVACQLKRYDTDAGEVTLATADSADGELVGSLHALLANLNMYRPHIPTWLLLEEHDEAGNAVHRAGESHGSIDGAITAELRSAGSSDADAPPLRFPISSASLGGSPTHRRSSAAGQQLISYATIDYKFAPTRRGVRFGNAAIESVLDLFSDVVHRQAALTRATIHDFTGDQLHVSWNTTHEVLLPQRGAVRFIRAVAKDAPAELQLTGAVCSGGARCQFAGSGSTKAFTVSMPWRDTLRTAVSFARETRCIVVDGETFDAVRDKFDGRAVEAFRHVPAFESTMSGSAGVRRSPLAGSSLIPFVEKSPRAEASPRVAVDVALPDSAGASLGASLVEPKLLTSFFNASHSGLYASLTSAAASPFRSTCGAYLAVVLYEIVGERRDAAPPPLRRGVRADHLFSIVDVDADGSDAPPGGDVTRALQDAMGGRYVEAAERLVGLPMDEQEAPLVRRLLDRVARCVEVGGDVDFPFSAMPRVHTKWNTF
jgi:hypothetical protein